MKFIQGRSESAIPCTDLVRAAISYALKGGTAREGGKDEQRNLAEA